MLAFGFAESRMYTVRLEVLLEMVEVKAHEDLRAEGKLVEFHEKMGKAAFVSHQWVSNWDFHR